MAKDLNKIVFSRQSVNEGDLICLTNKVVTRESSNGTIWATEVIVAQSSDGKNWFPSVLVLDSLRRASATPIEGTCYPHFTFEGSKKLATLRNGSDFEKLLKTPILKVEKIFSVRCNRKVAKDGDPTFAWNLYGLSFDKSTKEPNLKGIEEGLNTLFTERQSRE